MARITGTPREIERELRRRARELEQGMRRAHREMLKIGLLYVRGTASGPFTSQYLRLLGHPYAVRNPRPPLPVHIINIQTGRFRQGWRREGPFGLIGGMASRLINRTPYGEFLDRGTARMIPRRIVERANAEFRPIWQVQVRRFARGAIIGN